MITRRVALASLAALGLPATAGAEPLPDPFSRFMMDGRYLAFWKAVTSDPKLASLRTQAASFLGDEGTALSGPRRGLAAQDLATATAQGAITAITAAAAGQRVVILNEAHDASRHRMFLVQVLRALRPLGFTHLAAETFDDIADGPTIESVTAQSGLLFSQGFYTADPVYSEAVREALQLGYRLARYEVRPDQDKPGETRSAAMATREQAEADNFAALLSRYPQGRFLVYVGYSHLSEKPDGAGNRWFAARLAEKTGIDPLTITQANNGSFGPAGADGPLTRAVIDRFKPTAPILVRSADGVVLGAENDGADLGIFHPSLPAVSGRPGWLAADPMRRPAAVDLPAPVGEQPVLAQALHEGSPEVTVPADHYLLSPGDRSAHFFLRPGRYQIRLETEAGYQTLGPLQV